MFMVLRKSDTGTKKITEGKKPLSEIVNIDVKVSLDVIEVKDYREKITAAYNRIYYIAAGSMELFIRDREILLQKGDACFVEKGTTLELAGTFEVIIIGQPQLRL